MKHNSKSKKTINDISLIELENHDNRQGNLVVIEELVTVQFPISRVFIVNASKDDIRGKHAHYECTQFLICTAGCVEVVCDDGKSVVSYNLDNINKGLLIPAGIWSTQNYKQYNSTLTVLCDRLYEEDDYIRNYDEFVSYKSFIN